MDIDSFQCNNSLFCFWVVLDLMSKVSDLKSRIDDASDVSNIRRLCPLVGHGCQDEKVSRKYFKILISFPLIVRS